MKKAFLWIFVFWTLYTAINSLADTIYFDWAFPWYADNQKWMYLRILWVGFVFVSGWCGRLLYQEVQGTFSEKNKIYDLHNYTQSIKDGWKFIGIIGLFILFFVVYRYILFKTCLLAWGKI